MPHLNLRAALQPLFIELKTERGQTSPEQRVVMDLLRRCGFTVMQLRPRDFDTFVRQIDQMAA